MRQKSSPTRYLDFNGESSVKVSQEYRNKYQALSDLLDANPIILDLAHHDWCDRLSASDDGRISRFDSEHLLRAIIVMFVEAEDFRGTVIPIDNNEFLRYVVRLGPLPTMDFTFLNRAYCALSAATLEAMNAVLNRYAVDQGKISGEKQRMDSTVYEVNIHYPTDSSLLWASFRTLAHYLPLVAQIIDQADRRVLKGQTVPPDEKLYSLFEEHTPLIQRGKAGRPVEFGHKVLFAQTGEKFIHHYQVQDKTIADKALLAAHKALFETYPETVAADKGFYESMDQIGRLEKEIKTVSIAKKGARTAAEYAREHTDEFKAGPRFRAGSEGSISVLKRVFKLARCLFKGFKHYAASVSWAVLCHNLVLLARL